MGVVVEVGRSGTGAGRSAEAGEVTERAVCVARGDGAAAAVCFEEVAEEVAGVGGAAGG